MILKSLESKIRFGKIKNSPRVEEVDTECRVRGNKKQAGDTFYRWFISTFNVILERERSELSRESINKKSIFYKRMHHSESSANGLALKAKDDVSGWCVGRELSACCKSFASPAGGKVDGLLRCARNDGRQGEVDGLLRCARNDGRQGEVDGLLRCARNDGRQGEVDGLLRCARNDERQGEVGRSMIEMLGVLAIIAVLSVGGIAGYSKAMAMWRSNIQRNMISELIASTIKMKPNLNAFDQKYNILNSVIYAMGDMPEGLEYKNNLFYDKNGVDMYVMQGKSTWRDQNGNVTGSAQRLIIFFRYHQGDGKSSLSAVELCRNIIEAAKPVANEVLMIAFWEAVDTSIDWTGSKSSILYTGQTLKNTNISDIMQKCRMNIEKGGYETFLLYLNPY